MVEQQEAPPQIKIGELLTEANIVTTGDIVEAIQISKRLNLPIGRVMIMSGCLGEDMLRDALEAQSLIKEGQLPLETALEALRIAYKNKLRLQEALQKLDWKPEKTITTSKLGALLIDSDIVTEEQLDRALKASFQTGMPLGGTLVLQGLISAQLLPTILHVQEKLREGRLDRYQAVDELKGAVIMWASAEQSKLGEFLEATQGTDQLKEAPITWGKREDLDDKLPLREILQMSGFFSGRDLKKRLEEAVEDKRIFPKLAVLIGLADQSTVEAARKCQSLFNSGRLKEDQVVMALQYMRNNRVSIEQTLKELNLIT